MLLDSLGRVQMQAELEERFGLTLNDAMLESVVTLGDLRRLLGFGGVAGAVDDGITSRDSSVAVANAALHEGRDVYPRWTWWRPVHAARIAFIECVLRPLVWLLADPEVVSPMFT